MHANNAELIFTVFSYVHDCMHANAKLFLTLFSLCTGLYDCMHAKAEFFTVLSADNFYSIFLQTTGTRFTRSIFCISANNGPDLYIRESYKLGFVLLHVADLLTRLVLHMYMKCSKENNCLWLDFGARGPGISIFFVLAYVIQ